MNNKTFYKLMSLAIIITAAILIGQTSWAATNNYAWPTSYCTDKDLVSIASSRDIFYGKLENGICYGQRVPSVLALQTLANAGYTKISATEATALTNQITINKTALAYTADYANFLASPVLYTVSKGISANALTVNTETTSSTLTVTTSTDSTNLELKNRITILEGWINQLSNTINQLAVALGLNTSSSLMSGSSGSGSSGADNPCAVVGSISCFSGSDTCSSYCTNKFGNGKGECHDYTGVSSYCCLCTGTTPFVVSTDLTPIVSVSITTANDQFANIPLLIVDMGGKLILPIKDKDTSYTVVAIASLTQLNNALISFPALDSDFDNDIYPNLIEVGSGFSPWGLGTMTSLSDIAGVATGITINDYCAAFPCIYGAPSITTEDQYSYKG